VPDAFTEEMAVLLRDNWPSHMASDMIDFLTEGRLRVTISEFANGIQEMNSEMNCLSQTRKRRLNSE
jgi:hypothetical protein